jgi:hypothetical protein
VEDILQACETFHGYHLLFILGATYFEAGVNVIILKIFLQYLKI